MRSIAYIAIVALAATQGMEIPPRMWKLLTHAGFKSRVVALMIQLSDVPTVKEKPLGRIPKHAWTI